jgi:hypothetical protein
MVLAGVDSSRIVDAALADTALTEVALPRFEPACSPPCDALLWRLETATGMSLNQPGLLARHWHRPPYALTMRLVQYQPNSIVPEVLDEGTLGTRGSLTLFKAAVDRLAMRFVRDAALGFGRGPAETMAAPPPGKSLPGWMDAMLAKWHGRLMTEWWGIGSASAPMDHVLLGGGFGEIAWYRSGDRHHYLADPFPWFGTDRILCEEMPLTHGVGRIVAVSVHDDTLVPSAVLLDDGQHHSYPCTLRDGDSVYCVPESPERGTTRIHRLDDDGRLVPICDVAPYARLADPTLFRWKGQYWLACTDLDLGSHDNLCLLHAPTVAGPFTPHTHWPVKIDIRGARPAGMLFNFDGRLFRPGQDCAATYGAAVAIHEILALTETEFREAPVALLRPDKSGPFPHGLHTLVHDGTRFWVDGKRYKFDPGLLRRKLVRRVSRLGSGMGG